MTYTAGIAYSALTRLSQRFAKSGRTVFVFRGRLSNLQHLILDISMLTISTIKDKQTHNTVRLRLAILKIVHHVLDQRRALQYNNCSLLACWLLLTEVPSSNAIVDGYFFYISLLNAVGASWRLW